MGINAYKERALLKCVAKIGEILISPKKKRKKV